MLTFLAETREYVWGELRDGDRPSRKQIRDHLRNVQKALPPGVKQIYGRADSGFYGREAIETYEEFDARFVICARKTSRLAGELRQAQWKPSPKTDSDAECEFHYQPDGWSKPYRFVALRKEKPREELEAEEAEQYQLFETSDPKVHLVVAGITGSGCLPLVCHGNLDAGACDFVGHDGGHLGSRTVKNWWGDSIELNAGTPERRVVKSVAANPCGGELRGAEAGTV